MKGFPELAAALREMLERLDASLQQAGHRGGPVKMHLAGGLAVNYHCRTRYTEDVDASFSHRFLLPRDLTVNYRRRDGTGAFIYFEQDQADILALAAERYFDARELRQHALAAIKNHVGDKRPVQTSLDLVCERIERPS